MENGLKSEDMLEENNKGCRTLLSSRSSFWLGYVPVALWFQCKFSCQYPQINQDTHRVS